MTKVKAHLSLEQATVRGHGDLWSGNAAADSLAKARFQELTNKISLLGLIWQ